MASSPDMMQGTGSAVVLSVVAAVAAATLGAVLVLALARRRLSAAAIAAPLVVVFSLLTGVVVSGLAMVPDQDRWRTVLMVLLADLPIAAGVGLVIAWRTRGLARDADREAGRRQLVAFVSHDLRSPLAGMLATTEALQDGIGDRDGQLSLLRADIMRLSGMVDDLLALSRLQAPAFRLDRTTVGLADLVSDVVASARPQAQARGVELVGSAGREALADVDPREITRATDNLVTNALRYTPRGGQVAVTVSCDGDQAVIEVQDGCGGLTDDAMAHLFDAGWRGDNARTPGADDGGAGLGLAIVREVAAAHGGTVDVRNHDGGCRFTLRIPRTHPVG